jgi:hypothetical protein
MKKSSRSGCVTIALFLTSACAPSISANRSSEPGPHWLLLRNEIMRGSYGSALEAIRSLRSEEVATSRGDRSDAAVYLDGSLFDVGLSALANVPVDVVCEVRFLRGPEAELRFARQRVIVVSTSANGICR